MDYYLILLPLAILLVVSKILMKLCERIKIPAVIGMLLAGMIIGLINYIPGQTVFCDSVMSGIGVLAKIGVILILFSAGLETDLKRIKSIGGPAVIITCAGVIVPMALGFLVSTLFNGGFSALNHDTIITNLFYGTILTATSVSVSVATLREVGKLNTKVGTTIVAAAIIDDILGIVVLSLVLAMKNNGTGAGSENPLIVILRTLLYFVVIAIVAYIMMKFFKKLDAKYPHHRLIPIFGLSFCFLISYISEKYFGIADITGAYIVGLILSTNSDSKYIDRKADILGYMIFVPIFFGNIGISTRFTGINTDMILFGVLFIIAGMVGKVIGCGGAAACCGYGLKDSAKVGIGMMARAEVALVTAQKGLENGIIDSSIMPFIVIMIIVTSFVTPVLLQRAYRGEAKEDDADDKTVAVSQ